MPTREIPLPIPSDAPFTVVIVYPESKFTRSEKEIQAHSAPLGMAFLQATKLPEWLRNSAAVAYHGSWDRSRKTGYKVVIFLDEPVTAG